MAEATNDAPFLELMQPFGDFATHHSYGTGILRNMDLHTAYMNKQTILKHCEHVHGVFTVHSNAACWG